MSVRDFIGVVVALVVLGEQPNDWFWIAGALMAAGVWLHVAERHEHDHVHEPREHHHMHVHDEHHRHEHSDTA